MQAATDREHPRPDSVIELVAASRADTLLSWSEGLDEGNLVVYAPLDGSLRPVSAAVGEHLDVVWRDDQELRTLPVVLVAVQYGERPRWHLRAAGVVRRGQRREAVRAPLRIPVRIGSEPMAATATTVDVSEGGCRCALDRSAQPIRVLQDPDRPADGSSLRAGDVVRVAVQFPDFTITCPAEVARIHDTEHPRVELSLRFIGLTENQQDLIRRRVFVRLRELRFRGLL